MCEALRSDGRYRTISNLSYSSPLNSVNGFIPDSESETEYPSFFEVASAIVSIGLNDIFFSLFDVHSAYRNLRIACADWRFSIIAWKNLTTGQRKFWLDVALAALRDDATQSIAQTQGRTRATAYFYHYELPKIGAWLQVVSTRDPLCATMPDAAF